MLLNHAAEPDGEDLSPEAVVEAVNSGAPVPGGMGVGNPVAARFAITRRATGRTRDWLLAHPDANQARLERFVVLTYDAAVDLSAVQAALDANPNVLASETNWRLRLHATTSTLPSDPLMEPGNGDPSGFQWSNYLMSLPTAWQRNKGHVTAGLMDTGLETSHPDLRAFHAENSQLIFDGGNHREHRSYDLRYDNCGVDELDGADGVSRSTAGHGSFTAGLLSATTDNALGIAGICWHCSAIMMKIFPGDVDNQDPDTAETSVSLAADGLESLITQGTQIGSMSFGVAGKSCENPDGSEAVTVFCSSLALAEERDLVLFASPGNDRANAIEFPARDPRVLSIGGIEPAALNGFSFWDEYPLCPLGNDHRECGSNYGPEQDLAAAAKNVTSTAYTAHDHNTRFFCGDSYPNTTAPDDGFGICTGTSLSAPSAAGVGALVRSVNPLLKNEEVRDVLISTASHATSFSPQLGYGVPNAAAALERVLGRVGDEILANRLTPLFSAYSTGASDHASTTSPQQALAWFFDPWDPYDPVGSLVPGYPNFPGPSCSVSPCTLPSPRAGVYLFTSEVAPYPGAPPLVPLYRMVYDPNLPNRCTNPLPPHVANRDYTYTTEESGILYFKTEATDPEGVAYELDGVEGYLFKNCVPEPACIPPGTVKLLRYYHPQRDDWAIFGEPELPSMLAQGYLPPQVLNRQLGYLYPSAADTDGDQLGDSWENLLGTNPALADTDCDTISDGDEVHKYQMTDPNPANHGYRDPLDGPCVLIFRDGFESGNAAHWTQVVGAL